MKISVENYDDYDEIEIIGMRFYSRGDERNFFYHLFCLNIQAWANEDIIQISINHNLQKWQVFELVSLLKRYEIGVQEIFDLKTFREVL